MSVGSGPVAVRGAFHGTTIESLDLETQLTMLREECHEAVNESRRSKLYCQQVRKELQELVTTELDHTTQGDHAMFGGIAALLSNTNTLVEKFAAFEVYLRDKLSAEQAQREERLLDESRRFTEQQFRKLHDDVRQTLITFKEEIVVLGCAQKHTRAEIMDEINKIRQDADDKLRSVTAACESAVTAVRSDVATQMEQIMTSFERRCEMISTRCVEGQDVARKQIHSDLSAHMQQVDQKLGQLSSKVESVVETYLTREEENKLRTADSSLFAQRLEAIDKKLNDTSVSLKKFVNASLADVKDAIADTVSSCAKAVNLQSLKDEVNDVRVGSQRDFAAMRKSNDAYQERQDEAMRQIDARVADVRNFVSCEARRLSEVIHEKTQSESTKREERLRSIEMNFEDILRKSETVFQEHLQGVSDSMEQKFVVRIESDTKATESIFLKHLEELSSTADSKSEAVVQQLQSAVELTDKKIKALEETIQMAKTGTEASLANRVSQSETALQHRLAAIEASAGQVADELNQMHSVFVTVFGSCSPTKVATLARGATSFSNQATSTLATFAQHDTQTESPMLAPTPSSTSRIASRLPQPLDPLEVTLDRQKHKILEQLLEGHLNGMEQSIEATNDVARQSSQAIVLLQKELDESRKQLTVVRADVMREVEQLISHNVAALSATHETALTGTDEFLRRHVDERVEHTRRAVLRNTAVIMASRCSERRRRMYYNAWVHFVRIHRAKSLLKKRSKDQRALSILERTVIPTCSAALRRRTFALWKMFLVTKRQKKRCLRLASSCNHEAGKKLLRVYVGKWMRYLRMVRTRNACKVLQTKTTKQFAFKSFQLWKLVTLRRRKILQCRQRAALLALAFGHTSGSCVQSSRSITSDLTIASISRIDRSFSFHRHVDPQPAQRPPVVPPVFARLLRSYFLTWCRWSSSATSRKLRHAVIATDGIVDKLQRDVATVVGELSLLRDDETAFREQVSSLIARQRRSAGVSATFEKYHRSPVKLLRAMLRSVIEGEGNFLDAFESLLLWVDVIERTHHDVMQELGMLQTWMTAIDEEIRKVVKFPRPPFK